MQITHYFEGLRQQKLKAFIVSWYIFGGIVYIMIENGDYVFNGFDEEVSLY